MLPRWAWAAPKNMNWTHYATATQTPPHIGLTPSRYLLEGYATNVRERTRGEASKHASRR
ncbi:hypothetical protein BN2475_580018 [Paraburkholderia ribeironis]|uniref:Uncharacterized protein n=1 Tax=Paraburkholderia ribeironis TaxID=1247936 RepID=A0A1N7SF96_9BURK|nr:hypothetical protein BN2475_580018 [Paraburkholderia ribeironis]